MSAVVRSKFANFDAAEAVSCGVQGISLGRLFVSINDFETSQLSTIRCGLMGVSAGRN